MNTTTPPHPVGPGPGQPVPAPPPPPSTLHSSPASANGQAPGSPAFPRQPGETPRAFGAFITFFQSGPQRSLLATADALGESLGTVKNWSSKYRWSGRLHAYQSGLLQAQVESEAALQRQHATDWARRTREFREHEWMAGQKLLTAVLCFLENFGDREVERMTLAQVSRALHVSTRISRQALHGDHLPDEPSAAPLQAELAAALKKAYGQPPLPTVTDNGSAPPAA